MPSRIRPIEKFAQAVAKCSAEASIYGKCIVADYNSVHKDKCLTEFLRLKDCYMITGSSKKVFVIDNPFSAFYVIDAPRNSMEASEIV